MNNLSILAMEGKIKPGDILLIRNGERGVLNWLIRRAQWSALWNYNAPKGGEYCLMPEVELDYYAAFTHAVQVGAISQDDGPWPDYVYEQYAPHARTRLLAEIPEGAVVLIKRLKATTPERIGKVLDKWRQVAERKEPYPVKELVYYYTKWSLHGSFLGRMFDGLGYNRLFVDRRTGHNVCSGQVVECSKCGGWFAGQPPEKFYPALLAADLEETQLVMEVKA